MDGKWKATVRHLFTVRTSHPLTVVRVTALENGRGSSTWVWLAGVTACQRVKGHLATLRDRLTWRKR